MIHRTIAAAASFASLLIILSEAQRNCLFKRMTVKHSVCITECRMYGVLRHDIFLFSFTHKRLNQIRVYVTVAKPVRKIANTNTPTGSKQAITLS